MRRLAVFTAGFALGVGLAVYLIPAEFLPHVALAALVLGLVGFLLRGNARLRVFLLAMGAAAGLLWSLGYDSLVAAPSREMEGVTGKFTAEVADFPVEEDYGHSVDLRIDVGAIFPTKTRAYAFGDIPDLRPGDTIEFTATLSPADNVNGERITTYTSRGIYLFATNARDVTVISSPGPSIKNFHRYAARAIKGMIAEIFPLNTGGFMAALLTGDRGKLDPELTWSFERTGISHIVSVSGMHVSILVGFVTAVFGRRRWAMLSTIPLLLAFTAVTGFTPSVVRAVVMQLFLIAAPLIMRENDNITSLSAALMLILLQNPNSAAGVGLQLSFASTLGIIVMSPGITHAVHLALARGKRPGRVVRSIAGAVSATAGAIVFTLPLTALYFHAVSLAAPVVNVLVVWLVTPTFVLGIAATGAGFIFLPAGRAIAYCAALPARVVCLTARAFAGSNLASISLRGDALTVWVAAVYTAVVLMIVLHRVRRWGVYAACAASLSLCAILVARTMWSGPASGYTLTVLDVGQGQSIVLSSGGCTAVIDCGSSSGKDAGEIAENYIRALGRDRIDVLILTHYHADHANGAEHLFRTLGVGTLLAPLPLFGESTLDERIISEAEDTGAQVVYVEEALELRLGETVVTLYPPTGGGSENERCLSMVAAYGDFETLITGDSDATMELQLLMDYALPDIECLVVGHHGSATSTCGALLDEVKPEYAVISVGENTYGHPAGETLQRLTERGIEIWRTDVSGNVTITAGGSEPAE